MSGQALTSGQGSVAPAEDVALSGSLITSGQGAVGVPASDVTDAATGSTFTGSAGTAVAGSVVRLRSRKVGGGSASRLLDGISFAGAASTLTPFATRALTGSSFSSTTGSVAKASARALTGSFTAPGTGTITPSNSDPSWLAVPTITFTDGAGNQQVDVRALYTTNVNTAAHDILVAGTSAPLATGLSLTAAGVLTFTDATGSSGSTAGVIFEIRDKTTNVSVALFGQSITSTPGTVTAPVTSPAVRTGLDWDGTALGGGATFATGLQYRRMLYFNAPPPIYPLTFYFKVFPRRQVQNRGDSSRYWTTFFWGNNGTAEWVGPGLQNTYYGAHPYPWTAGGQPTGEGKWEISVYNGDLTNRDLGGQGADITLNRWYSQAFVANRVSTSQTDHKFYIDLPSVAGTDTMSFTVNDSTWANTNPPNPCICFGQAPDRQGVGAGSGQSWGGYAGYEEANEIIRGIAICVGAHSQAQIVALQAAETDAEFKSLATANGVAASSIWYLNMNPTPNDVTDKSGNAILHNPLWDGTGRPALYSSGIDAQGDWTARTSGYAPGNTTGVFFRQNFPYANVSQFCTHSLNPCYYGLNDGSGVNHDTNPDPNRFAIIPSAGLSGSAMRLSFPANAGTNGITVNFTFDNNPGIGVITPGTMHQRFYFQIIVRPGSPVSAFDWPFKDDGGGGNSAMATMKVFNIDRHDSSTNVGEVVFVNTAGQGFIGAYRKTDGSGLPNGPFSFLGRWRNTPQSTNDSQYQGARDTGTPSSPSTMAQYRSRYGMFGSDLVAIATGSITGSTRWSQFGVPRTDTAGIPWAQSDGSPTVITVFIDRPGDRIMGWASKYGQSPVLIIDSTQDNVGGNDGRAGIVQRNASNANGTGGGGSGYPGFQLPLYVTANINAAGAAQPTVSVDYLEIIASNAPINHPGGYTLPGNLG